MLARKVYDMMHKKDRAESGAARQEELKQFRMAGRVEFPTLQQLAKAVVAENFERYPHLAGIPPSIKAEACY